MKFIKRSGSAGGRDGSKRSGASAGGFKKRSFGGASSSFRDRGDRGSFGASYEKPQLHRATCAGCGESCEVPFKPNGSKPVYCRDCFKKEGGDSFSDRSESRTYVKRSDSRPAAPAVTMSTGHLEVRLDELEIKIDRIMRELEKLTNKTVEGEA